MAIKEIDIQKGILTYLKYKGIFAWRNNTIGVYDQARGRFRTPGFGSIKGAPDILGSYAGKPLGIEVKAPKGTLSDHQKAFKERALKEGWIYILAREIDDVRAVLDSIDRP